MDGGGALPEQTIELPWSRFVAIGEIGIDLAEPAGDAVAWIDGDDLYLRAVTDKGEQLLAGVGGEAVQRGELATLHSAEAIDAAPRLAGDAVLAGFYVNELTLRLAPRQDPLPTLHAAYARTRAALLDVDVTSLAWTPRRYERDLLEAIGFGFDWYVDGDGAAIDLAARYRLDPEHGPRRLLRDRGSAERSEAATGVALLALAGDHAPMPEDLASLRRPMRGLIAHHLGGRGLKSWEMAAQLRRLQTRG